MTKLNVKWRAALVQLVRLQVGQWVRLTVKRERVLGGKRDVYETQYAFKVLGVLGTGPSAAVALLYFGTGWEPHRPRQAEVSIGDFWQQFLVDITVAFRLSPGEVREAV